MSVRDLTNAVIALDAATVIDTLKSLKSIGTAKSLLQSGGLAVPGGRCDTDYEVEAGPLEWRYYHQAWPSVHSYFEWLDQCTQTTQRSLSSSAEDGPSRDTQGQPQVPWEQLQALASQAKQDIESVMAAESTVSAPFDDNDELIKTARAGPVELEANIAQSTILARRLQQLSEGET